MPIHFNIFDSKVNTVVPITALFLFSELYFHMSKTQTAAFNNVMSSVFHVYNALCCAVNTEGALAMFWLMLAAPLCRHGDSHHYPKKFNISSQPINPEQSQIKHNQPKTTIASQLFKLALDLTRAFAQTRVNCTTSACYNMFTFNT